MEPSGSLLGCRHGRFAGPCRVGWVRLLQSRAPPTRPCRPFWRAKRPGADRRARLSVGPLVANDLGRVLQHPAPGFAPQASAVCEKPWVTLWPTGCFEVAAGGGSHQACSGPVDMAAWLGLTFTAGHAGRHVMPASMRRRVAAEPQPKRACACASPGPGAKPTLRARRSCFPPLPYYLRSGESISAPDVRYLEIPPRRRCGDLPPGVFCKLPVQVSENVLLMQLPERCE